MKTFHLLGPVAFILIACSGNYKAADLGLDSNSSLSPDSSSPAAPSPSPMPAPPIEPLPVPAPTPAGWSMNSPISGKVSSDTSPKIFGTQPSYTGGQVRIYADAVCQSEIGSGMIDANGEIVISNISFKDDNSEDGRKDFYARIEKDQNSTTCLSTGLTYNLDTDVADAMAKHFRLTWREDPATTMIVGFAARNGSTTEHKIHYDTEDHGRDTEAYRNTATANLNHSYHEMNNAFARLSNLRPNTVYYFVVEDSQGTSRRFSFKTAPNDPNTRLSIIVGGDSRNNRTPRRNANLLVSKLRPHFVFFAGDMTNRDSPIEWDEWFEDWQLTIGPDGRMTPIVAARGNHERNNDVIERLFDTPSGVYYALTFGGNLVRAYTLNTESSIAGNQTTWLRNDLEKTNTIWKMAQYHKPMSPHTSSKREGNAQYQNWANLFYQNKMNLVSEADSHVVKSTWPIRPNTSSGSDEGFIRDDNNGTTYIGEGCWGAPLKPADDSKAWTRSSGAFNHFNWVHVDSGKMEIRVIRVDNAAEVGHVKDSNIFAAPAGLRVWAPNNRSVLTIQK